MEILSKRGRDPIRSAEYGMTMMMLELHKIPRKLIPFHVCIRTSKEGGGVRCGYHRVSRKIPITYLYRCLGGYDISRFKKLFFKPIQLKFEIFQKCYELDCIAFSIVSDTHQKMNWCNTSNVEAADELNRLGSDLNFLL